MYKNVLDISYHHLICPPLNINNPIKIYMFWKPQIWSVPLYFWREQSVADSDYTGTDTIMRLDNFDITCATDRSCPPVRTDTTKSSLCVDTGTKVHAWVTSTLICIWNWKIWVYCETLFNTVCNLLCVKKFFLQNS